MANLLRRLAAFFSRRTAPPAPEETPPSPAEAYLRRRVTELEQRLKDKDEEADLLRLQVRVLTLDREAAQHETRLYAGIIERDRKRVEAETAKYAADIADAERGD